MTIVPPSPGEPRRPDGPRDAGDAWVVSPSGEKYWGRFGAAGLLAVDAERGILLQHRVSWSHFGGTWGLPGGALHEGEDAIAGALREAQEEAGIPDGAVRPRFTSVLDLGIWSYATVVSDVVVPFDPVISDPESVALAWVPLHEVDELPLHPGFGDALPGLRARLDVRPAIVVDAANVVGSVPDGWWKDRVGAATRLRDRLLGLAVPAADLALEGDVWFPAVSMVVEGQARGVESASGVRGRARSGINAVDVVRADAGGDDTIVAEVTRRTAAGETVTVVTSDRRLRERVEAAGASQVRSAGWLVELLALRDRQRHDS